MCRKRVGWDRQWERTWAEFSVPWLRMSPGVMCAETTHSHTGCWPKQPALICWRRTALGGEATWASSEPAPHLPMVLFHISSLNSLSTLPSSYLKWPKDKLLQICSARSGTHPKRTETFAPFFIRCRNRLCNSAFQVSIHGKYSSNVFSQSLQLFMV